MLLSRRHLTCARGAPRHPAKDEKSAALLRRADRRMAMSFEALELCWEAPQVATQTVAGEEAARSESALQANRIAATARNLRADFIGAGIP